MRVHVSIALAAILMLGACSPSAMGELSRKYAEAARSLGVNPVYPPREEFQIGDVYLVSVDPKDPNSAVPVWLGTLDTLRTEASAFLKTRVAMVNTGVESNRTTATSPLNQEDLFSPDISTRGDERVTSLPITGFPSITMTAGSTASTGLTAAVAALGFGQSEQTTVTLNFNDVRTYWVPEVLAAKYQYAALSQFGGQVLDIGAAQLPDKIAVKELNDGHKSSNRCLKVEVVTRVYLTRQITYTYADRQIIAAGIKIATAEGGKAQQVAPAPAITVNVLKSGTDTPGDTAAAIAESLRQSTTATSTGAEGAAFSFVSWNARGLTFAQTYQRPVAIGWEGFQFNMGGETINGQRTCTANGIN